VAPKTVIPMHYGTFPVLTGTPEVFERELKKRKVKARLRVMRAGETIALDSKVKSSKVKGVTRLRRVKKEAR
jgi:L-ascorbate metabolism protein UlaG (beta-lactamase superfamily)